MKRYNFALLPMQDKQQFIQLAERFQGLADCYQLSQKSHPHVTLQHFVVDEKDLQTVISHAKKMLVKPLSLTFTKFSFISFDEKLYWLSLIPNEQHLLFQYHEQINEFVKSSSKKKFDPHLTLINTRKEADVRAMQASIQLPEITSVFQFGLGLSDAVGQMKEILMVF